MAKSKPPIKQKYIETPERMWELFLAYKEETLKKPFLVKDWVGKDGDEVFREKEKPLTMEGFSNYLDVNDIITDPTDYFENKDNRYDSYIRVCSRIRRVIRQNQIEGGMAGMFNPSITQRLNGLADKTEAKIQNSVSILNIDPLDPKND